VALNFDNTNIISELRKGNERVLLHLYKEYRDEYIQFAHKNYGLTREELKDVFQETVIAFYENVASGRLQYLTSDVKTYLFAIGKRQASTYKKNLFKIGNLSASDDIKAMLNDIAEEMEQPNELEESVKKVLAELPEHERKILELFYYEKKNMEEIASIMGYANANSMKKKKSLILKKVGEQVIKLSKGLLGLLLWMHMN
jgi:RNA polymerase sigma-70 factor (ECF subfamily)